MINKSSVDVIRGNMSEIKAIANVFNITDEKSVAKGVDVSSDDIITKDNIKSNASLVKAVADKLNTTIAVSGAIDIISDGVSIYLIDNGEEVMSKITGSGCMLTCVIGSFCAITSPLEAAIIGSLSMAISGELARRKMEINNEGSGSFRTYLIDMMYNMNDETIMKYGKLYKLE